MYKRFTQFTDFSASLDFTGVDSWEFTTFEAPESKGPLFSLNADSDGSIFAVEDDEQTGDSSTSGVLTLDGTFVTSSMDFSEDDDWFAITIDSPENSIIFNLTSFTGLQYARFRIYDSNNNSIHYRFLFPDTALPFAYDFSSAGTYYVSISQFGDLGEYLISAEEVVDDFAGDVSTTGVVVINGAAVDGRITKNYDGDWFAVEIAEDNTVLGVSLLADSLNDRFRLEVSIRHADGSYVKSDTFFQDNDSGSIILQAEIFTSGTYYIALNGSDIGNYSVSASTGVDDHIGASATTSVVEIDGEARTGELNFVRDADWFALEVIEAESIIEFLFLSGGTLGGLDIDIYNSNGSKISHADITLGADADHVYVFQSIGTYYVSITDRFDVGTYTLEANTVIDDFSSDVTTSGVIEVGSDAVGKLQFRGDDDWFAVTIDDAQTVLSFLVTSETLLSYGSKLRVVDSSGQILLQKNWEKYGSSLDSRIDFQFDDVGTFYFSFALLSSDTTGTYTISTSEISDDYSGDLETTGSVVIGGGAEAGVINWEGDEDWFAFELDSTSRVIEFNYTATTDIALTTRLAIYDAVGTQITSWVVSGPPVTSVYYEFDVAGTYYASVEHYSSGYGNYGFGEYTLSAIEFAEDYTGNTQTSGVLDINGATVSGNNDYRGDNDWFKVVVDDSAPAIRLTTVADPSLGSLELRIYNEDGQLIRTNYHYHYSSNDDLYESTFKFTEGGIYYVGVEFNSSSVLGYTLEASEIPDDFSDNSSTSGTLVLDGSVMNGVADYVNDSDWFAFDITAQNTILDFAIDTIGAMTGLRFAMPMEPLFIRHIIIMVI